MFYGQNGHATAPDGTPGIPEDQIIAEHFGDKADGGYLDIGAWSGLLFSNTRHFAERGWRGVCVEPSPAAFLELMKNYAEFPRVELVNAAVADKSGLMTFHDCGGDAVGTLNASNRDVWANGAGTKFREITVAATTVSRLLDRFGVDFDALSIDTEGESAKLLQEFPLGGMPRLKAIVVEADGEFDRLAIWASQWGFTERARTNENLILLR